MCGAPCVLAKLATAERMRGSHADVSAPARGAAANVAAHERASALRAMSRRPLDGAGSSMLCRCACKWRRAIETMPATRSDSNEGGEIRRCDAVSSSDEDNEREAEPWGVMSTCDGLRTLW